MLVFVRSSRRWWTSVLVAVPILSCAAAGLAQGQSGPPYDLLIRGGTVVDGTGRARYRADVAVQGDRIARVSTTPIDPTGARRVIDATGRIVAPGFIDLHAHLEPLLRLPAAESHVRQGVTLALGGPDGGSPLPLAPYMDSAQRAGLGINVAYLVGHNAIRTRVMGLADRAPTAPELARMQALVEEGMRDGAFGLSTGLRYIPGFYSATDEVVALSRVAAARGGIYTSHLREEGLGLFEGVGEAIRIGREARIPIVLTHHKAIGKAMWGQSVRTLAMVDSARAAGIDVMIDQYPYTASQTGLSVLIPPWALADGDSALARRMRDPVLRDSILRGVIDYIVNDRGGGDIRRVQFGRVAWQPALEGKTLFDWATQRGVPTTPEGAAPLVVEGQLNGGATMIYHVIDEGDVRRIMQHPQTMIASDGRLTVPGEGAAHPRAYGTFPRVLGRYVREVGLLTLEEGVHKMTGMPAARLGLTGRGVIAEGASADLVVFDAATVADRATFADPHQYPAGIGDVLVNGVPVVSGGTMTAARPGKVLRHVPSR
ncbi:MAG: D-aminoacylase [Gemmatimonadetes bacterium]|nr:D-aminoacylase [Gemmatimonadota bacterium]MBK6840825.1 D-aminoacylase [Gemmatimonadota bacterium]MBK8056747.1 D-aminoacylase [Gemmatimonadota bacterium]MBK8646930.1 D-aminoacylase [Gemmatimonadota bacterium]MBK9408150.1 D-aminoacylase [Gemmatimonadota bacterium]